MGYKQETILGLDTKRMPVYGDSLVMIMRPSLKQHVGLLPDDVSRGPKLSKPLSCVASLDSAQPLSSYHIDALASRLSPHTKDICRDKPTTGLIPLNTGMSLKSQFQLLEHLICSMAFKTSLESRF